MPVYNFHETLASLNLTDTPIGYAPARGPAVYLTLTYNQREATQPANFSFGNVGSQWSLSWLTYIVDDPRVPGGSVTRHVSGGGAVDYRPSNPFDGTFVRERADASLLVRIASGQDITYERHLSDGTVEEVQHAWDHAIVFPRKVFLRRVTDPAGNSVSLTYDARLRLTSITDALGRDTVFSYNAPIDQLLISKITDPVREERRADLRHRLHQRRRVPARDRQLRAHRHRHDGYDHGVPLPPGRKAADG